MRKLKYYSKKLIKLLFLLITLSILIISPYFLFRNDVNNTDGLGEIESVNAEPQLVGEVMQVNTRVDEGGVKADFELNFDETSWNGYTPYDYFIVLTKSNEDSWAIDYDEPLYLAPKFETIDEVINSQAYYYLKDEKVPLGSFVSDDETEIENERHRIISEHILNNENHFINNSEVPYFTMYQGDYTWTISSFARFKKVEEDGSVKTKSVTSKPIKATVDTSLLESKSNYKDTIYINAPLIELNDSYIKEVGKTTGAKHNELNKFIYSSSPSDNNGWLTVSNFTNLYAPRFNLSYENLLYIDEIFKVPPTIDLQMYLSDDTELTPTIGEDVLIYDTTYSPDKEPILEGIVDNEINSTISGTLEDGWSIENKKIIFNPVRLSHFENVYDDTNTLQKSNIKLNASLHYEYKTIEEINAYFEGHDVQYSDDATKNLGKTSEQLATENDLTLSLVNEKNTDNWTTVSDDDIFAEVAQFDKSDMPDFVVYPNWDENGKFNVIFATTEQYIFNSVEYSTDDMEMYLNLNLINERTGVKTESEINIREFTYEDTSEYGRVFYSIQYPVTPLSEVENYYISNDTWMHEEAMYNSMNSHFSYDQFKKNGAQEDYWRRYYYDQMKVVNDDDFIYNAKHEGPTLVLPDNIRVLTLSSSPDLLKIGLWLIFLLFIFVIIPLILYFILVLRRKAKGNY